MAIETKSGSNKPTRLQELQLRLIETAGGLSLVVNEENLPDFGRMMAELAQSLTSTDWSSVLDRYPSLKRCI